MRALRGDAALVATALIAAAVIVAAVYVPDVGRGFVKDDFGWIRDARLTIARPSNAWLQPAREFYRPLVTESFALDYALHGLNPRWYGFTNLTLYVACALAISAMLGRTGVSPGAAAIGAFAWAMNPHGINMAVVWLSGRTSLLLTLFSVLAAHAFLARRRVLGALLLLAALLSKEEATMMPFVIGAWVALLRPDRRSASAERHRADWPRDAVALAVPLAVYAVLRSQTAAMTPVNAPWFYRPTFDARVLARNVVEYADRGMTFFALLTGIAAIVYGWRPGRIGGPRDVGGPRYIAAAAAWFAGGYALTLWLPVRSSLYALLPSVGSALACAAACDALRQRKEHGSLFARDVRMAAALACVLLLIPIYQRRNDRWVEPARLSARACDVIVANPPGPGLVVLEDDADERRGYSSFMDAFGDVADVAMSVLAGRPMDARVVTPPARWSGTAAARYKLTGGRIERIE
jgi:hypothetical protein